MARYTGPRVRISRRFGVPIFGPSKHLERQFRGVYERALRRRGVTGEHMLQILETRLDNVAYHLGFANTRAAARQLVAHGHVKVNGRKVNIPSYGLKINDITEI